MQYRTIVSLAGCNCIEVHAVDPKTVGQYTGLRDKNGKEIYKGDLILGNGYGPYPVFWDGEHCGFCSCCYSDAEPIAKYSRIEVVGNIHDNPDLLK